MGNNLCNSRGTLGKGFKLSNGLTRKEKKKRATIRDDSEFRNETIFNIQQFFFHLRVLVVLIYKTLCAVLNDERIAGMQDFLDARGGRRRVGEGGGWKEDY